MDSVAMKPPKMGPRILFTISFLALTTCHALAEPIPREVYSQTSCDTESPTESPKPSYSSDGGSWTVSSSVAHYSTYTTTSTSPPTSSETVSGVRFHPDGSSPGFFCEYPSMPEWEACNGPDSRDCWLRRTSKAKDGDPNQIDIHTDYENPDEVPKGIVREYWIELDGDIMLTADGFQKTSGKVFNRTFPAPLLEACWGDELVVHVKNNYYENGTTVHWHGIRQLNTNQMDGANGVTQCPIAKGDSFTYRWNAYQYGSTWYHSHYALQYSDGALGPLVIYGPHSGNWDINSGPVLVQDYTHPTAFIAYQLEKTENNFARGNSIVVNGQGHDPATGTGSYFNLKLTPGKKHLIRVVNTSSGTHFIFSIDNHPFQVVATDLVAIEPYTTTSLSIGIGQRYTIIVEADQVPSNYWIRTHPATSCNGFVESLGTCDGDTDGAPGIFDDDCVLFDIRTAIVTYDSENVTDATLPTTDAFNYGLGCFDEPYENLKPIVPWVIDERPANNNTRDRFTVGRQKADLPAEQYEPGGYQHWLFTPDFFWVDFGNPTILNTNQTEWDNNLHVLDQPYTSGYIFMILESNNIAPVPDNVTSIPLSHPIHWHGHDVVVLAQNRSAFTNDSFQYFNFDNPPRRDVVMLPAQGYIAIAFKADNPGAWLIHCHVAWHAAAGLAMINLESQDTIVESNGGPSALDETSRVCNNWRAFNASNPVLQDESGI